MHMRQLPWIGRVPGRAGSTAMAPEGGPGSEDSCRAKRPERGAHLDLTTERRGSPHTLVATKNQDSYERRAKQRRQDLEHVSALGGQR